MINQKGRFLKSDISLDLYGNVAFSLKDLMDDFVSDKTFLTGTFQLSAMRDGLVLHSKLSEQFPLIHPNFLASICKQLLLRPPQKISIGFKFGEFAGHRLMD